MYIYIYVYTCIRRFNCAHYFKLQFNNSHALTKPRLTIQHTHTYFKYAVQTNRQYALAQKLLITFHAELPLKRSMSSANKFLKWLLVLFDYKISLTSIVTLADNTKVESPYLRQN